MHPFFTRKKVNFGISINGMPISYLIFLQTLVNWQWMQLKLIELRKKLKETILMQDPEAKFDENGTHIVP